MEASEYRLMHIPGSGLFVFTNLKLVKAPFLVRQLLVGLITVTSVKCQSSFSRRRMGNHTWCVVILKVVSDCSILYTILTELDNNNI